MIDTETIEKVCKEIDSADRSKFVIEFVVNTKDQTTNHIIKNNQQIFKCKVGSESLTIKFSTAESYPMQDDLDATRLVKTVTVFDRAKIINIQAIYREKITKSLS